MAVPNLRPSPIAGLWYEGNPKALAASIDSYLDNAKKTKMDGKVIAIMSPHAGHRYSGAVAGSAFATIRGQNPDLVAIISPMHHPYQEAMLVTAHEAYSTPLGSLPVDRSMVDKLNASLQSDLGIGISPVFEDPEHSLEIVLPFLQRALSGEFKLLPIMLREQSPHLAEKLGHCVAKILKGTNCLLVASTDLSHFYTEEEACVYDAEMLRQVNYSLPREFSRRKKKTLVLRVAQVLWLQCCGLPRTWVRIPSRSFIMPLQVLSPVITTVWSVTELPWL